MEFVLSYPVDWVTWPKNVFEEDWPELLEAFADAFELVRDDVEAGEPELVYIYYARNHGARRVDYGYSDWLTIDDQIIAIVRPWEEFVS